MASGKNAVASILEKNGFACVDADLLVHKAIEISRDKIIETFANIAKQKNLSLLKDNGSINRRTIGELVFNNKDLLKKQESIVYPVVEKLAKDFISQNSDKNIALNATVLYKTKNLMNLCDKILFVSAPYFTRLMRAKRRDGISVFQIIQRFKNQKTLLSEYKKTKIPIIKINNNGNLLQLEKKVLKHL